MNTKIQTVLGPIDAADAGRVMMHEHLLSLTPGPWLTGGAQARERDQPSAAESALADEHVEAAVGALSALHARGFGTVVDLSPYGVVGRSNHGENVVLLQEISRRTGLHIVSGTSVYLEAYSPDWTLRATLDELTSRLVGDLSVGIGDSEVRAGILGEQATGLDVITDHEEKCLRATARAALATGVAVMTHTTHGTMAGDQLRIMADEGVDLSRVVVGHMDIHPALDAVLAVVDAGACVAIDTIGKQHWDFVLAPPHPHPHDGEYAKRAYHRADASRADLLVELERRGYLDQVVIAQDLTGPEVYLNPATHGQWGYSYLDEVFLPMAHERGLTANAAETLLRVTPARLLTAVGHA